MTYDTSSRLYQVSNGSSSITYTYATNGSGVITGVHVVLPDSSHRYLAFDSNHYLTGDTRANLSTNPAPETTTYTRDAATELVTTILDPLPRTTNFVYDGNNSNITLANLTSVTEAAGTSQASTTTIGWQSVADFYDEIGSIEDPLQHTWTFGIDQATGNIVSVTEPQPVNNLWSASYWPTGQLKSWANSLGNTTNFCYSTTGCPPTNAADLSSITDPVGNTTALATDSVGRVTSLITPMQEKTTYQYDAFNHVTSTTDPDGNTTSFVYNLMGEITQLTDPRGNATTWTYVPPGSGDWDVKQCDPAGKCNEAKINWASGLPTWSQDKLGYKTTYTYDALQRVIGAQFSLSGTNLTNISYTYDSGDRMLTAADTATGNPSTWSMGYDLLDNMTSQTAPEGATSYSYNWIIPSSMTPPAQPKANYSFDSSNRLTNVVQQSPGTLATGTVVYDAADRPTCVPLPNHVFATYSYDADSRVTAINYGYSTTATCTSPPANLGNLTYTYDADGRIVAVGGSLAALNLPPATSQAAAYNTRNQLTSWNGTNVSNNDRGDLTTDPVNSLTYAWNERGQLSKDSAASYTFSYDAFGRRETFDDLGVVWSYLYDGLQAIEANSNTQSQYFFTAPGGEVLAYSAGSNIFTPITDVLGSAIGLVNSSGSIATKYSYEPFGMPTVIGNASNYPFLFAGMEYDSATGHGTGLYHTWARYYHPRLQRFVSEDPLQFGGGDVNLFAYVENDPTGMTDPTGQQITAAALIGAGVIGGIVGAVVATVSSGGHITAAQVAFAAAQGAVIAAGGAAMLEAAGARFALGLAAKAIAGGIVAAGSTAAGQKLSGSGLNGSQIALSAAVGASSPMIASGIRSTFGVPAGQASLGGRIMSGKSRILGSLGLALMFPQHGMAVSQSPSGGGFPFGGQAAMFPIPAANAPSISGLELDGGNFSALDSVGAIPSPLGGGGCPVVSFM